MTDNIIILTGVSASGKTTLQNELLERGWKKPVNFTTRKPRTQEAIDELKECRDGWENKCNTELIDDFKSSELDEYVFLNKRNFFKKLENGDFLEHTNSYGDNYAISRYLPDGNVVLVLDPTGRAQVMEYFVRLGIAVQTYYLEIPQELQNERLGMRNLPEKDMMKRQNDYKWFTPTNKCFRLNGAVDVNVVADIIEDKIR